MNTESQNEVIINTMTDNIDRNTDSTVINQDTKESTMSLNNLLKGAVVFNNTEPTFSNPLFENLLNRGQTVIITTEKGAGSTWVASELARAITSGDALFSHYQYVAKNGFDKEIIILFTSGIPVALLKQRISWIKSGNVKNDFYLFAMEEYPKTDDSGSNLPFDMTQPDWLDNVNSALLGSNGRHVTLIFDALDSLVHDEMKKKDFQKCIRELRKNPAITQIWIHKGGKKDFITDDCVDLHLQLNARKDRSNIAMDVKFIKSNFLDKDKTLPFVIEVQKFVEEPYMRFVRMSPEIDKENVAIAMMIEGVVQTEIAKQLKVSQPMVSTWRANGIEKGLIKVRGHNNIPTSAGEKLVKTMRASYN